MSAGRAAVVGGSLGGLFAALALSELGWEVDVYERSPQLRSRGAGLVVQPELASFLERYGGGPAAISVPLRERQSLDVKGSSLARSRSPQLMTSWDLLHAALRRGLPPGRYHAGAAVTGLCQRRGSVEVRVGDQPAEVDLAVAADGLGSTARRLLVPESRPHYAGYVAWRGLLPEAEVGSETVELMHDQLTFYNPPSMQFLCYFVPGPSGQRCPGERRLNWLWYLNLAPGELAETLGRPPGEELEPEIVQVQLLRVAGGQLQGSLRWLPPMLAEIVSRTAEPFAQAIFDLSVPRMAFGRACLLGDAAFVVRPQTASGASKAAGDALALADALEQHRDVDSALAAWEPHRMQVGQALARWGRELAARSRLGAR